MCVNVSVCVRGRGRERKGRVPLRQILRSARCDARPTINEEVRRDTKKASTNPPELSQEREEDPTEDPAMPG